MYISVANSLSQHESSITRIFQYVHSDYIKPFTDIRYKTWTSNYCQTILEASRLRRTTILNKILRNFHHIIWWLIFWSYNAFNFVFYYHLFSRDLIFTKLKSRKERLPQKWKTRNLVTWLKNLYLSCPSARCIRRSRGVQMLVHSGGSERG